MTNMAENTNEQQYLNLARYVLENGHEKSDRTGTGTRSVFGYQMRFDLSKGFPLLTTKKVPFGLIKSELLWFLRGDTNIRFLLQHHNHIWDEWAFKKWVTSSEYHGPDMTDFGHRWLMIRNLRSSTWLKRRPSVSGSWTMTSLPRSMATWDWSTEASGGTGRPVRGTRLTSWPM